jgi:two-component system response regulator HupR/HoxA
VLGANVLNGGVVFPSGKTESGTLKDRVEALESTIIAEALERLNGNISRVASELGLSRVGLRNKIERYALGRGMDLADE